MLAVNTNAVLSTGAANGAGDNQPLLAGQGENLEGFTLDALLPMTLPEAAGATETLADQVLLVGNALPALEAEAESLVETQASDQKLLQAEELLGSLLQQQQMLLHAQQPDVATLTAQGSIGVQIAVGPLESERQLTRSMAATVNSGVALSQTAAPMAQEHVQATPMALVGDALPLEASVQGAEELLSSTSSVVPRPGVEASTQRHEAAMPGARPQVAEARLHLQGPESRWGEQMLNALRDSVELQLKQNKQQAIIRLDPAELGSLEIRLSQESGRLQVQIHAAQGDVARLLQQTSERLRHDLATPSFSQIDVQVGSQSQSGQRQPPQAGPGLGEQGPSANHGIDAGEHSVSRLRSDVLVSV